MKQAILAVLALSFLWSGCQMGSGDSTVTDSTKVVEQDLSFPGKAADMTVYEVNIRQHTVEGTINAFINDLPRLQALGAELLWIMPIQPIGEKNRKGELGSYYSIRDYTSVNPEFGNIDDFKRMVQEAHKLGFYVILDWVPNHTAWDHPWITEHPEYYATDEEGNITYEADWTDIALLDHTNPEVRAAMQEKMRWWVEETDIDGFRCDHAAHEIPMLFWEETIPALNKIKDLFWLAEWDEPKLHPPFHASYDWEYKNITNAVAEGEEEPDRFIEHFRQDEERYGDAFRLLFTTNHDENAWEGTVFERLGAMHKAFAVFTFTVKGVPMLYSGQEVGLDERLAFFRKDTIDWSDPLNLQPFYTSLIDLRKENPALWTDPYGGNPVFLEEDNAAVLAYTRTREDNSVTVIVNFSNDPQEVTIAELEGNSYWDYFTGTDFNGEGGTVQLVPAGYKVLIHKTEAQ